MRSELRSDWTGREACPTGRHRSVDESHDGVERGAGLEDGGDALPLERGGVFVGNDAADDHLHVGHVLLAQQFHHARHDGVVRAGKNGQADHLHVFLQRGVDDHLRSLAQAGVDHFHAGVAQGARDHLGAAVVAVQPGLGHQHSNGS